MRKIMLALLMLVSVLVLMGCTSQPATPALPATSAPVAAPAESNAAPAGNTAGVYPVMVVNNMFQPTDVEVKTGETVEWVNNDGYDHTVTFDTIAVDELLPRGGSTTYTFTTAGEYSYHCGIHRQMQGKIIVK